MNSIIHNTIRRTILSYLPGSRVLLFGSRARGDHDRNSDYDLLVITAQTLTSQEKLQISKQIDKAIVEYAHVPIDLLINSEEEIREKQQLPGHIIRSAIREGITL